jgi:hypothetical protein
LQILWSPVFSLPSSATSGERAYNTALRTFPTVIWAKTVFAGNKPIAEFAASEGFR